MQRELAEFTSAEFTVGSQATGGGQALSTAAKGLAHFRSVGATVGAFLPARRPGAHGAAVDALSQDGRSQFLYEFPPLLLLTKVINKVKVDRASMILVRPSGPGGYGTVTCCTCLVFCL